MAYGLMCDLRKYTDIYPYQEGMFRKDPSPNLPPICIYVKKKITPTPELPSPNFPSPFTTHPTPPLMVQSWLETYSFREAYDIMW